MFSEKLARVRAMVRDYLDCRAQKKIERELDQSVAAWVEDYRYGGGKTAGIKICRRTKKGDVKEGEFTIQFTSEYKVRCLYDPDSPVKPDVIVCREFEDYLKGVFPRLQSISYYEEIILLNR